MTKIIVVDDDLTNAGLIKMLLELDGYEVVSCADIAQAKTAASTDAGAFVIDCHLARGASGLDLVRDVRQGKTDAAAEISIIVTSGDHRREPEAMEAGADQFLLKPYPPDTLSEALKNLLAEGDSHGE